MTDKFDMHCIVELFGHSKIAGRVSEQTIGGASFIRVDVPKTSKRDGFTRFYGPGAIYAMTPVAGEIANLMAERLEVEAVSEWTLQQALRDRLLAATASGGNGDRLPVEGDEESFADDFEDRDPSDDMRDDEPDHLQDKRAAAQWARDLLAGEFVIVDTETTGFDKNDQIIQIGIVDQAGDVVLERLIKPTISVPNAQYHGITDETLVNAPGFPEVYGPIKRALEGKTVVTYNADYDIRMLNQDCQRHHLDPIRFTGHCAMEQYAQFNGEWNDYHGSYRWKKLREALAAFGLKHEDFGTKEHDACTDARATLAVIRKMAAFEAETSAAAEVES